MTQSLTLKTQSLTLMMKSNYGRMLSALVLILASQLVRLLVATVSALSVIACVNVSISSEMLDKL